jgi:hypothetical protein
VQDAEVFVPAVRGERASEPALGLRSPSGTESGRRRARPGILGTGGLEAAPGTAIELRNLQSGLSFERNDLATRRREPGLAAPKSGREPDARGEARADDGVAEHENRLSLLGLDSGIEPSDLPLALGGRVGGIAGIPGEIEGQVLDAEAILAFTLWDPLRIYGSYRLIASDFVLVGSGSGDWEVELSGFGVGASLRF